jgi:hypothetical protein
MPGLMETFDSLPPQYQAVVKEMSNAARETMAAHGTPPLNDDHAARFDEACAKFLKARIDKEAQAPEVRV